MRRSIFFLSAILLVVSCRKDVVNLNEDDVLNGPVQYSDATVSERVYGMKKGTYPYLPRWSDTMYAARVKNGTAKVFMGNSQIERMIWFNWDANWRDSLAINRGIGGTTWSEKIPYYFPLLYEYVPGDAIFYDGDNEYLRWTQASRKVSSTIIPTFNRAMDSVTKRMPRLRIFIVSMVTSPKLAVRGFGPDIDSLNKAYKARVAADNAKFPGRMHFVDIRSIYPTNSAKWETDSIHIKGSYYYEWFKLLKTKFAVTPKYNPTSSNLSPIAKAGADKIITRSFTYLDGNGSTDPDGFIKSYQWRYVSGPLKYSIVNPVASRTRVQGLVPGTYVFRLTVTDNKNATASDDIRITVR